MMLNSININSLLKQLTILNCILIVLIIIVSVFVLVPIFSADIAVPVYTPTVADRPKAESAPPPAIPPLQDYIVVSEKNLFHPGRILPAKKKEETIQRPEFVLYGTLITDVLRIAYLSDNKAPRSTPGRGKRQTGLKLGETMSGYMLKDVLPDRITMVRGDDSIEIKVIAPGVKKNRGGDGNVPASVMPGAPAMTPASTIPPSLPAIAPGGAIPAAPGVLQRPERRQSRNPRIMNSR